jgi:hypothetical protein
MNNHHECDEEFYIPYNDQETLVNVICEGNDVQFYVHLPERQVKLVHDVDEEGRDYWIEDPAGETRLAMKLGELIEYASLASYEPV